MMCWEIQCRKHLLPAVDGPHLKGTKVSGRVKRVVLRGKDVFRDGQVLAQPGSGKNIRMSTFKIDIIEKEIIKCQSTRIQLHQHNPHLPFR